MTQTECSDLLRQIMIMRAHNRTMSLTTATELWCTCRMVTSATRTLLLVHLGTGTSNLSTRKRRVSALLATSQLPAHYTLKNVIARIKTEDFFVQLDLASIL